MMNSPLPLRDYDSDPYIRALQRRGFINQGSTFASAKEKCHLQLELNCPEPPNSFCCKLLDIPEEPAGDKPKSITFPDP